MTNQNNGSEHSANHGLNTPSEGKTDWHLDLNENFDELDRKVEIRDTEGNKGDYEPKDGAKYVATDSGAVYHGNGTSWVLADREVDSLSANRIHTVPEGSVQDIADMMNKHRRIRLEEGATYTSDSEVIADPGEFCYVDARGATLQTTATGSVGVISFESLAKCANDVNYAKRFEWHGGIFKGAGNGVTESGIRMTDTFGCNAMIGGATDVTNGIHLRNYDCWCEANEIGYKRSSEKGGNGSDITSAVRLDGASVTGGSGTASMRTTEVRIPFGNSQGDPILHQQGCGLWGGHVFLQAFMPDDGTVWFHDPDNKTETNGIGSFGNVGTTAFLEFEGGNSGSVGIDMVSGQAPTIVSSRMAGNGTKVDTSGIPSSFPLQVDKHGFHTFDNSIGFEYKESGTGAWQTSLPIEMLNGGDSRSYRAIKLGTNDGNIYGSLQRTGRNGDTIADAEGIGLEVSESSGAKIHMINRPDNEYAGVNMGSAAIKKQRADPDSSEINSGESMIYSSDGSGTGSAGDLVRAYNDNGTIKTQVIAPLSDAT